MLEKFTKLFSGRKIKRNLIRFKRPFGITANHGRMFYMSVINSGIFSRTKVKQLMPIL